MKINKIDDNCSVVCTNVDELSTMLEALETAWCIPCGAYSEGHGCRCISKTLRCKNIIEELAKAVNDGN